MKTCVESIGRVGGINTCDNYLTIRVPHFRYEFIVGGLCGYSLGNMRCALKHPPSLGIWVKAPLHSGYMYMYSLEECTHRTHTGGMV